METSKQLADRFREVLLNGRWIANTNYQELLQTIPWKDATTKIGSLNTIAAITFHINYYIEGISYYFIKGSLEIKDKFSFSLPPIRSEEEWINLLSALIRNAEVFANLVEQMPQEKLKEVFFEEQYGDHLRNITGVIEHCYYHLGQISLINKILHDPENDHH